MVPCSNMVGYQRFGGPCCFHLYGGTKLPPYISSWKSQISHHGIVVSLSAYYSGDPEAGYPKFNLNILEKYKVNKIQGIVRYISKNVWSNHSPPLAHFFCVYLTTILSAV